MHGALTVQVEWAGEGALTVDQWRIHVTGPTSKAVLVPSGPTAAVDGLLPGTYEIGVEGLVSDRVAVFGEAEGLAVVVSGDTPASVTVVSFVPVLEPIPDRIDVGESVPIYFSPVSGTTGYTVEIDDDAGFGSPVAANTFSTTTPIVIETAGTHYVRVFASNRFGSVGQVSNVEETEAAPNVSAPNFISLESDFGDYVGQGGRYEYDQTNAVLVLTANGGGLSVTVEGDESWRATFKLPDILDRLVPGEYTGLERYPFHDKTKGGLSWSGEGRGCNRLTGWFAIDSVSYYAADLLRSVDLRFEQHCEGGTSALRGTVHWKATDETAPPGPVDPPPSGLWQPADGVTPTSGNYVYLESEPGDFIGGGTTWLYTGDEINLHSTGGHAGIRIDTSDHWLGDFQAMNTLNRLVKGYYADVARYPFHNPTKGGLSWGGNGRGCNRSVGWFVVDRVEYNGNELTGLDLRFEQRCEAMTAALHGEIRWNR